MSYHDSTRYYERWLKRLYRRHSGQDRFVQNGYSKKTPDTARADWRRRKGFARDQAKGSRRSGCPKWLKRQCNKDYRAWVRDLIKRGKFEEIGTKTRKDFFDSWMWD